MRDFVTIIQHVKIKEKLPSFEFEDLMMNIEIDPHQVFTTLTP